MKKRAITLATSLLAVALVAWGQAADDTTHRRCVVTFDGKVEALPGFTTADFEIQAGKKKLLPSRIYGPDDLPTVLAIVLQENLTSDFATQLPALREFILNQPPNTYIGLFYLSAQSIEQPERLDAPRERIAEALRMPKGMRELAPPNPYEPLARILAFMHSLPKSRKEVLLFSEGSDALADAASPGQNRSVRRALEVAHQSGIPVWVIYTEGIPPVGRMQNIDESRLRSGSQVPAAPGPPSRSESASEAFGGASPSNVSGTDPWAGSTTRPRVQYGLSYLKYMTERSGGKVLSSGKFAADVKPYLDEFARLLRQQYVLEFPADEPPKKVKLKRKISGAKFRAPKR